MSTSAPLPDNDPRVIAWNAYKATDDFANTRKWALDTNVQNNLRQQYVEGSLWASFLYGFEAGGAAQVTPREDELREKIDNVTSKWVRELTVNQYNCMVREIVAALSPREGAEQQEEVNGGS